VHIVYQMGKVGSSTVYESLRRAGIPNLFKVHYLSDAGLDRARRLYAGFSVRVPVPHEESSVALQRMLRAGSTGVRWKVFTLVREPVARDVSAYVQMVDLLCPELVAGGPRVDRIARAAAAQFLGFAEERSYTCRWFAEEFGAAFGLDVFAHPFDAGRGWLRIRSRSVDIAVVRMEDLSRVFEDAAAELTGVSVPMVYASARSPDKLQAAYEENVYRQILDRVRIPEAMCRKVYRSRYARHFYTDAETARFTAKWARLATAAPERG